MKTFICYKGCSTCTKARKQLEALNIDFEVREITEDTPTVTELKTWLDHNDFDIKKLFNTSGLIYRKLELKDKINDMSEDEKLQLLSENGMLIKRPLLVDGHTVIIGYNEKVYANL